MDHTDTDLDIFNPLGPSNISGELSLLSMQGCVLRDTTSFLSGATLGVSDTLIWELGWNFLSASSLFARHTYNVVRFLGLPELPHLIGAVPSLVLFGSYFNSEGSLPPCETFTFGGPCCCRGYIKGELGVASSSLLLSSEF